MRLLSKTIFLFVAAILPIVSAQAADGDLDTSFDSDGRVISNLSANTDELLSLALQADGKIIAGGRTNQEFALARYLADGSLDTSFDSDGKLTTNVGASFEFIFKVLVQPDGKILAAGKAGITSSDDDFALVRYNGDGSLDTGFGGGDGIVNTDVNGGNGDDGANDMALQSDGKIILVGFNVGLNEDYSLVRYNTDGSLDSSFGTGGIVKTDFASQRDVATCVVLQVDGKIVVAGRTDLDPGGSTNFGMGLARYLSNGSLDTSFGSGGKVSTTLPSGLGSSSIDGPNDVVLQSDGKIVVAGTRGIDFLVGRYNPDGSLDTSFDSDGLVTTDFAGKSDEGKAVGVQADGKILVSGSSVEVSNSQFGLARYNTDGSLDTSFDGDGKVLTEFNGGQDTGKSLLIQSDGKVLVGGNVDIGSDQKFGIARYEVTPPTYQADNRIGSKGNSATHKGNNIYNLNGAGQNLKLRLKGTKLGKVFFSTQNDGTVSDSIRLNASKGSSKFKVNYFRLTGGKANITGAITKGGGFFLNDKPPGSVTGFLIDAKAKKNKNGKQVLNITGSSLTAPSKLDRVKALLDARPQRIKRRR